MGVGDAGNDVEAENCFARSLELVEAVKGPGHADAVFSLGAYAAFLKSVPPCSPACLLSICLSVSQYLPAFRMSAVNMSPVHERGVS